MSGIIALEEEEEEGREISQALHHGTQLCHGLPGAPVSQGSRDPLRVPSSTGDGLRHGTITLWGWRYVWEPALQSSMEKREPGVSTRGPALDAPIARMLGFGAWFGSSAPVEGGQSCGAAGSTVPALLPDPTVLGVKSFASPPPEPSRLQQL